MSWQNNRAKKKRKIALKLLVESDQIGKWEWKLHIANILFRHLDSFRPKIQMSFADAMWFLSLSTLCLFCV